MNLISPQAPLHCYYLVRALTFLKEIIIRDD